MEKAKGNTLKYISYLERHCRNTGISRGIGIPSKIQTKSESIPGASQEITHLLPIYTEWYHDILIQIQLLFCKI